MVSEEALALLGPEFIEACAARFHLQDWGQGTPYDHIQNDRNHNSHSGPIVGVYLTANTENLFIIQHGFEEIPTAILASQHRQTPPP